jgi:hypothetical protein
MHVNAAVYFNVVEAIRSVLSIDDYRFGTQQVAQTTLRGVLGQTSLDDLLTNRDAINQHLQQVLDQVTDPWGVKVTIVEVRDVILPESMRRAMARQAEAERDRRAKVIHAIGEKEAATTSVRQRWYWRSTRQHSNCGPWARCSNWVRNGTPPSRSRFQWSCCDCWKRKAGTPEPARGDVLGSACGNDANSLSNVLAGSMGSSYRKNCIRAVFTRATRRPDPAACWPISPIAVPRLRSSSKPDSSAPASVATAPATTSTCSATDSSCRSMTPTAPVRHR